MPEPVEIRVKLDVAQAQRDLKRVKDRAARDPGAAGATGRPGAGSQQALQLGASGTGFGLSRPAFPTGGLGIELPKAVQKQIGDTIKGGSEKAVAEVVKKIDWTKILRGLAQSGVMGGVRAAAAEGVLGEAAAARGITGAAAGGAGLGGALGFAGGVAGGLGIAALVAVAVKMQIDKMASNTNLMSTITGVVADYLGKEYPSLEAADKAINEVAAKVNEISAAINTFKQSVGQTMDLEAARLRLGQKITPDSVGSDFAKIRKLNENQERLRRKVDQQGHEEVLRNLVKSFAGGGR